MPVMEAGPKAATAFDLMKATNPTAEDIIRVFECRSDPVRVMKANAAIFEEVLPKVVVSHEELREIGKWAALGLSHCVEHGIQPQVGEFSRILDAVQARQASMTPVQHDGPTALVLPGWRV